MKQAERGTQVLESQHLSSMGGAAGVRAGPSEVQGRSPSCPVQGQCWGTDHKQNK